VARVTLERLELEGRPVPHGSMVFGLIAARNRDPAQIKAAETFDVTREQIPSLSIVGGWSGPGLLQRALWRADARRLGSSWSGVRILGPLWYA